MHLPCLPRGGGNKGARQTLLSRNGSSPRAEQDMQHGRRKRAWDRQVPLQNKEAAKIVISWHTKQDREPILHWMIAQTGTTKELHMMRKRSRKDILSYMSHGTPTWKKKGEAQGKAKQTPWTRSKPYTFPWTKFRVRKEGGSNPPKPSLS